MAKSGVIQNYKKNMNKTHTRAYRLKHLKKQATDEKKSKGKRSKVLRGMAGSRRPLPAFKRGRMGIHQRIIRRKRR